MNGVAQKTTSKSQQQERKQPLALAAVVRRKSTVILLTLTIFVAYFSFLEQQQWTREFQGSVLFTAENHVEPWNDTSTTTQQNNEQKQSVKPTYIPLHELVDTQPETDCPPGLVLIEDIRHSPPQNISSSSSSLLKPRKIPRIIHVTSRSRCVTPQIANVLSVWKNASLSTGHEFYFHNDAALHRLLYDKDWSDFPFLPLVLECANSMVEQADVWRVLALWEYGGIYTDLDNLPNKFHLDTSLKADDEAYFEIERGHILSQYFFAAEPRHPLMYFLAMVISENLLTLPDIQDQYAPTISGPVALKKAMKHFMGTHDAPVMIDGVVQNRCPNFERVCRPGRYVGWHNRTVTAARRKSAVYRGVIKEADKRKLYQQMNMTHFSVTQPHKRQHKIDKNETTSFSFPHESCKHRLLAATRAKWDQPRGDS